LQVFIDIIVQTSVAAKNNSIYFQHCFDTNEPF
jgi:hypothetical protein